MSTTTTNRVPVLVSKPYTARRSSTAWRRPRSPLTEAVDVVRSRRSKTSRLLERRRENWRGVRTGTEVVLVFGSKDGKMVMCSGLF
jgi:hypothetical protein